MDISLTSLKLPTSQLRSEHFQEVLNFSQKVKKNLQNNENFQSVISEAIKLLWNHHNTVLSTTESQLICSTSYFSLLSYCDILENHLEDIGEKISNYYTWKTENLHVNRNDNLIILSLIYGLYHSSFISSAKTTNTVRNIIENSFKILIHSAYEYSEFTFITFKTLQSLRKLLDTEYRDILIVNNKTIALLKLTSHNWENPITGVRDLNKAIFGLYLDITGSTGTNYSYDQLIFEINNFPWNKAKYLMLSEVVMRESRGGKILFEHFPDWLNGLIRSLTTSSLVSAGADMYFAVLKRIHSDTEWCGVFLDEILHVLNGSDFKMIQNFNNYWCMNTLKQFPDVLDVLTNNINFSESDNCAYAHLSILRQGNKLGLTRKNWLQPTKHNLCSDENDFPFVTKIQQGIEHADVNIRIQAFEIVCISHNNAFPTDVEFKFILKYLEENVNSDSTVLRLSMLNKIKLFFSRLLVSTMNTIRHCTSDSIESTELIKFCASLQMFLEVQLNIGGNYQRNVTIVNLCNIVLSTFSNPIQRKRKHVNITGKEFTLKTWLEDQSVWYLHHDTFIESLLKFLNDPAEDIRDSISEIVLNNYLECPDFIEKIPSMLDNSLKNLQSKFFYEVSSGYCGVRLIAHLLVKKKCTNLKFKTIEELFQYFFDQLITEIDNRTDILKSIETGKPLHSLVCVLQNILEVCLTNSYDIQNILSRDNKEILIDKLSEIPKFYTVEESATCSPDFAEMSEMVEQLIAKSTYKTQRADVKISDLHQILLNCVWLNLKACCELLCVLIKCTDETTDLEQYDRCLIVIANVLLTSRHKGAIEAAGSALGKSIKYLTMLSKNESAVKFPMELLKEKLDELIVHKELRSITRRGAGLSIMVHKIVACDMQKEKPLFHYAIKRLLEATATEPDIKIDTSNEKDIPKAIYIHLMTKMVADSSLASDVMFYSASLAQVAFFNLTSKQWQIRNAALQLYGALVPKLIGQKKASSENADSAATVGCDELRTHSPKLWAYMKLQIAVENNKQDTLQLHSNLVPTLNLLASTAKRYNFSFDSIEHHEDYNTLFINLFKLLHSPIYSVRRLTAKSIELIFPYVMIHEFMLKMEYITENILHGCLMLIKFCKMRLKENFNKNICEIKQYFDTILSKKVGSFVTKSLYSEIFWSETDFIKTVESVKVILNANSQIPGAFMWANTVFVNCIRNCKSIDIPTITRSLLDLSDSELYCEHILHRIKSKEVKENVLKETATVLLSDPNKFAKSKLWLILYEISSREIIMESDTTIELFEYMNTHQWNVPYKNRYIIPLVAKIVSNQTTCHDIDKLTHYILSLTDYESVDVDMRYIAAISNNILGLCLPDLSLTSKKNTLKAVLNMLQDDDEDVRFESAKFYNNVSKVGLSLQPFICLQRILDDQFLHGLLAEDTKQFILSLRKTTLTDKVETRSYNPFVLEFRNIYAEPKVFALYVDKLQEKKFFKS